MRLIMASQMSLLSESFRTEITFEGFFARMGKVVTLQERGCSEGLEAEVTHMTIAEHDLE